MKTLSAYNVIKHDSIWLQIWIWIFVRDQTDCLIDDLMVTSVFIFDGVNIVMISKWRSKHPIGMVPSLNRVAFYLGCSKLFCFNIGLLSNGCMHVLDVLCIGYIMDPTVNRVVFFLGCFAVSMSSWYLWTVYCSCISSGECITNSVSLMHGDESHGKQ